MSTTVDETLVFHDAREVESVCPTSCEELSMDLLSSGSDGREHALKEILARPIPIARTLWTSTQIATTEVLSVAIPSTILNYYNSAFKVSGFLGFRAKTILKVQVNTNRFQQGRLMFTFVPTDVPYPNTSQTPAPDLRANECYRTLRSMSQLPRIDFDAATDTEVELEVPFVSKFLYYNTINNTGFNGYASLRVYSPLTSASTELNANVTIWAHFEDVELVFPTVPGAFFVAQSGRQSRKNKRGVVGAPRNAVDNESQALGVSSLSGSLSALSKVSTYLSSYPLLSAVAGPTSWALAYAAKTAQAFGYGKVATCEKSMPVQQLPMRNGIHCTGVDTSVSLSTFDDNHVEIMPAVSGSSIDELNIAYLLSIPTFHQSYTWTSNNATGVLIGAIQLGPQVFQTGTAVTYNTGAETYLDCSPTAYISQVFDMYRGSFSFVFKFVKTEFHTGRLLVVYQPGDSTSLTADYTSSMNLHREVIDLRECSEYRVTCPYANTRPYQKCQQIYGTLSFFVQNELRNPDTVTPSIAILVEQYCASDFEFSVPTPIQNIPFFTNLGSGVGNTPGTALTNPTSSTFTPQAGEFTIDQRKDTSQSDKVAGSIGSSVVVHDSSASARFCIGERVTSLRQLMLRSVPWLNTSALTQASAGLEVTWWPWVQNFVPNAGAAPGPAFPYYCDYFNYIVPLYRFYRGGVRHKIYPTNEGGTPPTSMRASYNRYPAAFSFDRTTSNQPVISMAQTNNAGSAWPPIYSSVTVNPSLEFQVPYYNQTHCSYTSINYIGNTFAPTTTPNPDYPDTDVLFKSDATINSVQVCRAISDDFQSSFFIGVPALITTTHSTTTNASSRAF